MCLIYTMCLIGTSQAQTQSVVIDGVPCTVASPCYLGDGIVSKTSAETKWRVLPDYKPKPHFWQKHPTRTKVLTALGIGSIGLVVGLAQRHSCPNFYIENGKKEPYYGTPPCPK